ncbi:hypothetical protein ACTXT7_014529 [Hymenolepis weldensis]
MFTLCDLVFARDFRIDHSWMDGTLVKQWGKVNYEIQANDAIWIRHRNQLKSRIAVDTFELQASK